MAEREGRPLGSNFLDERGPIRGVGPITVAPEGQDAGIGRLLMQAVLDRAESSGAAGVRLLQAAYHNRSLSLYASLGFRVREPIACLQGPPIEATIPGRSVRAATAGDLDEASRLACAVHGHDRHGELRDAIAAGTARVVEHAGRITGYSTAIAFFGHTVGEADDDVKALMAGQAPQGPGVLVPLRNAELYRWALSGGLRTTQVMTLMTVGLYNEPTGAYLPSILY